MNTPPAASGQRHDTPPQPNGQTDSEPTQLDLIDYGQHAAKTRAIAAASSIAKGPSRRDAIELHVAGCGDHGATRWEISQVLAIPYTSVCGPVLALLTTGRLRETERTRETAYGKPATVIVSGLIGGHDA
ncbi:hypothetical protein [Neorhodopirellula lusitana]|nr:hypothetical protein [Neorhodopirellula lusitana]